MNSFWPFFYSMSLFLLFLTPVNAYSETNSIRIGGSYVLSVLPLLAIEQGIFRANGIDAQFERIRVGKLAMDAVVSGSVDFATIVDTNLALNSFHKSRLQAIATIVSGYDNGIAYRKGKNISSFRDLKGLRIAYLPATTSHFLLLHFLSAEGWTLQDIKAVPLQANSMLPALRTGVVDAVSIWNPWRYEILKSMDGKAKEILRTESTYIPMGYLATMSETIKKHPKVISLVLKSLIEAEYYAKNNREKVRSRYAIWNNMDEEAVESIWPQLKLRLDLKPDSINTVVEDVKLLKKFDSSFSDRISRSVRTLFDTSPLRQIAPTRVKVTIP